ncbi:MAG: hypothetical protein A2Y65_02075 [Deltaproteobacteria bacterium RBG_13_52_11]|nr:MAG: hypothetical protein A2Y65_02075 [Deltaproteobacteria bacterium RBG_13_52_11]
MLILVLMIIAFGGGLYIRTWLTKRAVFKVIEIFYKHNALGIKGAKTRHELGIERRDFLQRMTRPRDYKQHALQLLMQKDMIFENEDGRLYLDEKKLGQDVRSKMNDQRSQKRSS